MKQKKLQSIFQKNKHLLITLAILFVYSTAISFATPPSSPYTAGETLDPSCAPGDTNCSVSFSSTLYTDGTTILGSGTVDDPLSAIGLGDGSDTSVLAALVATTTTLPGFPTYNNGSSGVGATLTRSTNGTLGTIDGVSSFSTGDRILVKNQSTTLQNGIYEITQLGSGSTPYILTRTTDSDESSELDSQIVSVAQGTNNKKKLWAQQTDMPTVGTNAVTYANTTGVYTTQQGTGTQVSGQIPFWTGKARQLSRGTSDFTFDPTNIVFKVGSLLTSPNETYLSLNDTTQTFQVQTSSAGNGGEIKLGDYDYELNHTYFYLNDSGLTDNIRLNAQGPIQLGDIEQTQWGTKLVVNDFTQSIYTSSNASVGIGTDTPSSKLDVAGTITGQGLYINNSTVDGGVITDFESGVVSFLASDPSSNFSNVSLLQDSGTKIYSKWQVYSASGDHSFNFLPFAQTGTHYVSGVALGNDWANSTTYISFGGTDVGEGATDPADSYGFRDNDGVLQFKNSGGGWANIEVALHHVGTSYVCDSCGPGGNGTSEGSTSNLYNVFLGQDAGTANTTGENNVFIGWLSGGLNDTGFFNTFVGGGGVGSLNTSGSSNSFFGLCAGCENSTGSSNSFFGANAGIESTTGSFNIAFGSSAYDDGTNPHTGSGNIVIGNYIDVVDPTADQQLNIGGLIFGTGVYLPVGNAFSSGPTASGKIGIGLTDPQNRLEVAESLLGGGASGYSGLRLRNLVNTSTSLGSASKFLSVDASGDVGLYSAAISYLGTSYIGKNSGAGSNGTSEGTSSNLYNIFVGDSVGGNNTTGSYNTALGTQAFLINTTGADNIAIGTNALQNSTTGSTNVAIGAAALLLNDTGANNIGIGQSALENNLSGVYNIAIGDSAGDNATGSYNIAIGRNVNVPTAAGNQQLNVANVLFGTGIYNGGSFSSTPVSGGKIGILNNAPAYTLHVGTSAISGIVARFENSTGTCDINPTSALLSCSSDQNLKKNIESLETTDIVSEHTDEAGTTTTQLNTDSILSKVLTLRPVTYNWNTEGDSDPKHTGFIAQEVESIFPDLVTTDQTTGLKSLNYIGFIPYTIQAIEEMNITLESVPTFTDQTFAENVKTFLTAIGTEGKGVLSKLFAKEVHTEELCVGSEDDEVCVTKDELQNILNGSTNTIIVTPPASTEEGGNTPDTPTDQSEDTPSPEPEESTSTDQEVTPTPEATETIQETTQEAPQESQEPAPAVQSDTASDGASDTKEPEQPETSDSTPEVTP